MSWKINAAICSGKGLVRSNNEDSYYLDGQFPALQEMDNDIDLQIKREEASGTLWAVCDGMGGQQSGEAASQFVVSRLNNLRDSLASRDFSTVVTDWSRSISSAVYEQTHGGCTMVLLYFRKDCIQIAHIGDSRIYRFQAGKLTRLTRDHSKVEMLLASGMITEEEAAVHPLRHVITRFLGMNPDSVCDATIGNRYPVSDQDLYILCSDGLTDMLTDGEIGRIAEESVHAGDCAEHLYQETMKKGGRDNTTVMVLEVTGEEDLYAYPIEEDDEPTIPNES